jgi:hypothetical protein
VGALLALQGTFAIDLPSRAASKDSIRILFRHPAKVKDMWTGYRVTAFSYEDGMGENEVSIVLAPIQENLRELIKNHTLKKKDLVTFQLRYTKKH